MNTFGQKIGKMIAHQTTLNSRIHIAHLLVEKIRHLAGSDPIVVATSVGGFVVGRHLSSFFHTSLEMLSCKRLHHPSQKLRTIGSVCELGAVINDADGIPQNFISHQIILHQHSCRFERAQYAQPIQQNALINRNIIVVVDEITDANSVLAAITVIKKQNPSQVILTTGFISRAALKMLTALVDEVVYIEILAEEDRNAYRKITDREKESLRITYPNGVEIR